MRTASSIHSLRSSTQLSRSHSALWLALAAALAASLPACDSSSSPETIPDPPTTSTCPGQTTAAWVSDSRYCVYEFASDIGRPRQMAFAPSGELFVSNGGKVTVLADTDGNGTSSEAEQATFGTAPALNHGLAFSRDGSHVYASSDTTVYRWKYTTGAHRADGDAEIVVSNIPGGGHVTRTLVFDSQGRLYVSVGSATNVDVKPQDLQTRSQIRRFEIPDSVPSGGIEYTTGEVFASGMRNEVGLYVDARDRLWGVENGRDMLFDGSDNIHNDNPAEEVNLIDDTGASYYGYPSCFSEFKRPGGAGAGAQWADNSLAETDRKTDAWCRDPANVHPPAFALPAHWAPLGIIEYQGTLLPWGNDLIVTAHGSWNSDTKVGRLIARLHRDGDTITRFEPIIGEVGSDDMLLQGSWRPVDVREGPDGTVYVSDDDAGRVLKISYAAP